MCVGVGGMLALTHCPTLSWLKSSVATVLSPCGIIWLFVAFGILSSSAVYDMEISTHGL